MKRTRERLVSISRFLFVLFIIISAFVFAMFQGGIVSWTIFYAILPFILYSIGLFFYPLTDFTVKRIIQSSILQSGETFSVQLHLSRRMRFPLLYTVVEEKWGSDILLKTTEGFKEMAVLGVGKEKTLTYEINQMPRGEHVLKGVSIEVTDFFGWIRKKHLIPMKQSIIVYPKMTAIDYRPTDGQHDRGAAVSQYNLMKDMTMVGGVRDYQYGDRVSWIHWKSFARTETLMTKEFEDRRLQKLQIFFDERFSEAFEERVEFAASITKGAYEQEVDIHFLTLGTELKMLPVEQSEAQYKEVLLYLAKVMPDKGERLNVLTNFGDSLIQGGSMIVITSHPDRQLLSAIGARVGEARTMICFVIVDEKGAMRRELVEEIQQAEVKGIIVKFLGRDQFFAAFREVTHI